MPLLVTILTAVLNPPLAQVADYWGRKWVLVISTAVGFAGCMVIARAHSMRTILVGFALLGASYGSQSALLAVVSEVLPRKHRPIGQAAANGVGGLGAVVGLLMGGALLRQGNLENYRIYWYVTAGLFAISTIGCATCYSPLPRELETSMSGKEKLRQLDWFGYALFGTGTILLCLGLTWSQNPYSWDNAHILAPFILGCVILVAFVGYEWFVKRDGLLHRDLFGSRNFIIAVATIFVEGLSFFTANTYYAYEVTVMEHSNLLVSGLHFAIVFISTAVFATVAGLYSVRTRSIREPLVFGFLGLLIFSILMATATPSISDAALWGYPVFAGLGLGCILPISMVAAQLSTPRALIALTTGVMISARALGADVGLAINTAVYSSAMASIGKDVAAATLPLGLPATSLGTFIQDLIAGDTQHLLQLPGVTPQVIAAGGAALTGVYSRAFRNVWILASAFSFVAMIGKHVRPHSIQIPLCWFQCITTFQHADILFYHSVRVLQESPGRVQSPHRCSGGGGTTSCSSSAVQWW